MGGLDMNVDTETLYELQNDLKLCRNAMDSATGYISREVSYAGNTLEGRQYSLSVEETNAACAIISASEDNLSALEKYLDKLQEAVEEYLKCVYGG